jgi:hypothetical protein
MKDAMFLKIEFHYTFLWISVKAKFMACSRPSIHKFNVQLRPLTTQYADTVATVLQTLEIRAQE